MSNQIAPLSSEQSEGVALINPVVNEMDKGMQNNAVTAEEFESACEERGARVDQMQPLETEPAPTFGFRVDMR